MSTVSIVGQSIRFPSPEKRFLSPEKRHDVLAATPTSTTPPTPTQLVIPTGFSGQLKALRDIQKRQADRIAALESENAELKASQILSQDLLTRIDALEQHNLHLAVRRRECVSELLTLRPLHQDAANALHVRSQDVLPDDLEGMLSVHGHAITTALNHQQRALGQMRPHSYGPPAPGTQCSLPSYPGAPGPPSSLPLRPLPVRSQFPMAYDGAGYCHAHRVPYWCRSCGQ